MLFQRCFPGRQFCIGLETLTRHFDRVGWCRAPRAVYSRGSHKPGRRIPWLMGESWSTDLNSATSVTHVIDDLRSANFNMFIHRSAGGTRFIGRITTRCHSIDPLTLRSRSELRSAGDILAKATNERWKQWIDIYPWVVTYHVWKSNHCMLCRPRRVTR